MEFLRGVLGVLCVFFAHMTGRSLAAVRQGRQKLWKLHAWTLRTLVCGVALIFRHETDTIAIGVWSLAAAAFAIGVWDASRQRKQEDLTHEIFPDSDDKPASSV